MKLKLWLCSLILPACAHIHQPLATISPSQTKQLNIRVLLKKEAHKPSAYLHFKSESGFLLKLEGKLNPIPIRTQNINIKRTAQGFAVTRKEGKPFQVVGNELTLEGMNGPVSFDDLLYAGTLNLVNDPKKKSTLLINTLDLEEYVYGVLPREIYQSWPLEMHKVQAIATRSYAVHCIQKNISSKTKKRRKPYDIGCSKLHQTYCGTHQHKHVRTAIEGTRGIVLSHEGKAILAMFDSCCGGAIPADIDQHDFEKAPYLARKHPCTFCKDSKLFTWERTIEIENFIDHLKNDAKIAQKIPHIGPLISVSVAETDKAGLVKRLLLRGKKKLLSVASTPLYERMRNLFRSLNFSIRRKKNTFVANGKGYGHQIGLCQYGARELVRRGWDHHTILRFYYPRTNFSKVC